MPSPALTLGRDTFDAKSLRAEDPDIVPRLIEAVQALIASREAEGWPAAAVTETDTIYGAVFTKQVGGDDKFYAGEPNDPLNPRLLDLSAAGTSDIIIQWEGVEIGTRPIVNFLGTAVDSVTDDAGNTRIDVEINDDGGGGGSQNLFETITVTAVTGGSASGSDVVADSPTDTLTFTAGLGMQLTSNASDDKVTFALLFPYHLVKGLAKGAGYVPSSTGVIIDNVTSVHGATPVASSSDELDCSGLALYADDNDELYARFNNSGASGVADSWTTDTMANLRPILAGLPDYNATLNMLPGHPASATDASQQAVRWKIQADWLKTVAGYDAAKTQALMNLTGTVQWVEAGACP